MTRSRRTAAGAAPGIWTLTNNNIVITRLLHLALPAGHHGVVAAVVLLATLVHVIQGLLAVIAHTAPVAVVRHGQQRQEAAASLEIDGLMLHCGWSLGKTILHVTETDSLLLLLYVNK